MLQRDESGKPAPITKLYGFVVGAELVEGIDIQDVMNHISDALTFMEGVGKTDVEFLGEIILSENEPSPPQLNLIIEGSC